MLSIQALDKTYSNGVHAMDAVTLDVPRGMFGLLGPNGAGKSTLMRSIATLQNADSGTVAFDGLDIAANVDELRHRLGYLPQEFGVYPRTSPLTFLDHVAALKGLSNRADRKAEVEHLLAQTNLWDVRKKSMTTFSGGMKQRVGIAQALIGQPELIIVDEPTAGLDPVERRRFHNLLADIGEEVVVILSTHIVEDVADLCSRMAIMANGRILRHGEPQQLIATLRGRLWQCTVAKAGLPELRDRVDVLSTRRTAGQLEVKTVADQAPPGFEPSQPSLEDVYFASLAEAGVDVEVN